MVLIIGTDRWTIRPLISKKNLSGFGAEIPVEANLSNHFLDELLEEEKGDLEVHEHSDNKHYHFTVFSIERFIQLVKKWAYYFSHKERWEMSVKISDLDLQE